MGGAADLAGGVGGVAGGAMEWLGGLIQQEEGVEKLHAELSKALAEQPRCFLIVIDDIDRLSPDEALLIFRLVKSVGRLPNVMYLLVYDRQLAEKIVSERFPSEGPHYLEKIIQARSGCRSQWPPMSIGIFLRRSALSVASCPRTAYSGS